MRAKSANFFRHVVSTLALLVCLVLSACSSVAVASPRATPTAGGAAFVGKLEPLLRAKMQQLRIPGAIIFVDDPGQGSWTTTLGTSDLATRAPMQVNSYMRIGSITKTFTGTVILQLVDEGKLRLDDPVGKYQREVPNGANITIRQLLNMSSGLFNYSEDKRFNQTLDMAPSKAWNPKELLASSFQHPPYFAPGQGWHYSNTNTVLLGMIIEQLSGMPVENVFQQRIFKPLGMDASSLPTRTSSALPNPHPHGYMFGTNVESLEAPHLTPKQAAQADAAAGTPNDVTPANPSWGWTAGAAISTLHDLKIWAKALATGTLLSAATQKQRLSWIPIGTSPAAPKYGLAISNVQGFLGHNGQIPGFQSFIGYLPARSAMIVVLTNLYAAPDGSEPADELAKVILKELFA